MPRDRVVWVGLGGGGRRIGRVKRHLLVVGDPLTAAGGGGVALHHGEEQLLDRTHVAAIRLQHGPHGSLGGSGGEGQPPRQLD